MCDRKRTAIDSKSIDVRNGDVLLHTLYNTVGSHLLEDVQDNISKLLPKLSAQRDANSTETIYTAFQSVKLLVDMLNWSCSKQNNSNYESGIQEIFQCLREVLDVETNPCVISSALDVLQSTCKLCIQVKNNSCIKMCCSFYLFNLHWLNQNQSEENLKVRLRVLAVILKCFAESKMDSSKDQFKEECINQSNGVVDTNVFEKLIQNAPEAVSAQTLMTVIPHLAAVFDNSSTLLTIWHGALYDTNPANDEKRFSSLCYLFDVFATKDSSSDMDVFLRLLQDDKFWRTVQYGLLHTQGVIRRQSLYLLKRSVDEMYNKDLSFNSLEMNEISGANFLEKLDGGVIKLSNGMKNFTISNNKVFLVSNGQESVMWWHHVLKCELSNLFHDIFLVYETLEEKQAHIVKPIFQTVIRLLGPAVCPFRNGKRLHISWILMLFNRILTHDNAAVVRWGLINITEIDLSLYQTPQLLRTIIKMFVTHVNNPSVFVNEINLMRTELRRYFGVAAVFPLFFKLLIEEIVSVTWCPETLLILLDSLQDVRVLSWESSHLMLVKKFVSTSIATHYTFLRAAIQCHMLNCVMNLTDVAEINLDILADVYSAFRGHECLQRGSSTWLSVTKWIEYCFSKKNAQDYILKNVPYLVENIANARKASRMICLLYDAHLFGIMKCCGEEPSPEVLTVLTRLLNIFKNVDKRLYADQNVLNYNLQLICGILKENLDPNQPARSHLVEIMLPYFTDIIGYITSRSDTLISTADCDLAHLFVDVLELILKAHKMYRVCSSVNGIFNFALKSLANVGGADSPPLVKYVSMQYLKLLVAHVFVDTPIPKLKQLQNYLKDKINMCLERPEDEAISWGKVNSEYLEAQWCVISRLKSENILTIAKLVKVEQFLTPLELAHHIIAALELGNAELVTAVLNVAEDILPDLEQDTLEQLVQACWSSVWYLRRSELFATAARCFISMLFQSEIVSKSSLQTTLLAYSQLLLTESANGVANTFLKQIQSLRIKYNVCPLWHKVLASALLFGGVNRRDDRLTQQVSALVASLPTCAANDLVQNDWNTSCEVRARALQIVLSLSPEKHSSFADGIVDEVLSNELDVSSVKSRSFAGSPVHVMRTRLLQSLLVLEPLISKTKAVILYNWLCALLLRESQQPSARYLAEWLLVRLMLRFEDLQNALWSNFTEALEQRVGSLCSFISVVYHATAVVPEVLLEAWLDRAMLQFLPYCLAQHFSLRLYAQIAIEKMWIIAESKGLQTLLNKYRIMRECQLRTIGNGNAMRNAEKLRQDFYWTTFDPLRHYSLATIFRDVPRLAHLKPEEWITPELFNKVGVPSSVSLIPMSSGEELSLHPIANWTTRNDDSFFEVPAENLQKKLIPVKSLLPDYDSMLDDSIVAFSRKKQVDTDGLVVVASLVDRAANLGGLCRTCEAFGVTQLVIDSLNIIEDKQFQSLSVTSDKWVHIIEVKSHYLADYLMKMKCEGYTVVGAEQTSRSVHLQQAVLPRKSVLLLGSEKEGIPPQLLSLLDICIEVPQFGVVRSLNVHVTGALCIWEYVKQHAFPQTPP